MLILVVRTLILYGMVIAAMRIMGKRQLGELQPSELVVATKAAKDKPFDLEELKPLRNLKLKDILK